MKKKGGRSTKKRPDSGSSGDERSNSNSNSNSNNESYNSDSDSKDKGKQKHDARKGHKEEKIEEKLLMLEQHVKQYWKQQEALIKNVCDQYMANVAKVIKATRRRAHVQTIKKSAGLRGQLDKNMKDVSFGSRLQVDWVGLATEIEQASQSIMHDIIQGTHNRLIALVVQHWPFSQPPGPPTGPELPPGPDMPPFQHPRLPPGPNIPPSQPYGQLTDPGWPLYQPYGPPTGPGWSHSQPYGRPTGPGWPPFQPPERPTRSDMPPFQPPEPRTRPSTEGLSDIRPSTKGQSRNDNSESGSENEENVLY